MLINLSEALCTASFEAERDAAIDMDVYEDGIHSFPILEKEPVHLKIRNAGSGKASLEGSSKVKLKAFCDRCLKDVELSIPLTFERDVASPDTRDPFEDDMAFMEDFDLNVDVLISNEILLNMPDKILCKPDCKGLCKKCGKDLNMGDCGCDDFVPDPRMAAIKEIFDANKEV
ncbi:MAG: DUF177 domain-containing protein [Lachnospiraceae bacterium]|nr:DUF177 domain-containing protein [Lachnospiraceae bacterium]